MSGNSEEHSVLSMSDADFLNVPMPTFESASSIEQQEEEQPDVVFCIEQGPFLKQELQPVHGIVTRFERPAVGAPTAYQQYFVTCSEQGGAGAMHPLIGRQVVGYRDNGFGLDHACKPGLFREKQS